MALYKTDIKHISEDKIYKIDAVLAELSTEKLFNK